MAGKNESTKAALRKRIAWLDDVRRRADDAFDVAEWREGKLSGEGLLEALRDRGLPKKRAAR